MAKLSFITMQCFSCKLNAFTGIKINLTWIYFCSKLSLILLLFGFLLEKKPKVLRMNISEWKFILPKSTLTIIKYAVILSKQMLRSVKIKVYLVICIKSALTLENSCGFPKKIFLFVQLWKKKKEKPQKNCFLKKSLRLVFKWLQTNSICNLG